MTKTKKFGDNHWITLVIFFCILLSIFGSEWTLGAIPFFLKAISQVFPTICLLILSFIVKSYNQKKVNKHTTNWYSIGVITVLFVLLLQGVGIMGYNNIPKSELSIIQAIFFGYMAYWITRDKRESYWLLKQIAGLCVIMGFLDTIGTFSGISQSSLIFPSWHTRLLVLFGYCWYLFLWLTESKKIANIVFGLASCSAAVWITFQKPILFAAFFSTIFIFWFTLRTSSRKTLVYKRIIILIVISTSLFLSINFYKSGELVNYISQIVYKNFLRIDEVSSFNQFQIEDWNRTSGGRLDIWEIALEQFFENPLIGGGKKTNWGYGAPHVHNWYLDMLLWIGILGSLPFFLGIIWWFRIITRRLVLFQTAKTSIPAICYIIGLMTYNLGGTMRSFFSVSSYILIIMALTIRPAQDVLKNTSEN
ncbi:MAG: hypothetical protein CVU10_10030 [Bacteroidetes bacterium HGW-Bacteroidetes-5]|jgi:O-antigen ligase|nr:MAG: hypothetical protein CVU10_10030 [Bacteroidetes bacterium HGW-Bacteroidetes-5]